MFRFEKGRLPLSSLAAVENLEVCKCASEEGP